MTQEKIKTVCVDKMAYEAALRNSIKVNDLEAENQQLKELLDSSLETNKALAHRLNLCKDLLLECKYKIIADLDNARLCESSVDIEDFEYLLNRIDNAIGEKK